MNKIQQQLERNSASVTVTDNTQGTNTVDIANLEKLKMSFSLSNQQLISLLLIMYSCHI